MQSCCEIPNLWSISAGGVRMSDNGGSPIAVQLIVTSSPRRASTRSRPVIVGGAADKKQQQSFNTQSLIIVI